MFVDDVEVSCLPYDIAIEQLLWLFVIYIEVLRFHPLNVGAPSAVLTKFDDMLTFHLHLLLTFLRLISNALGN